ncbi:MAG: IS200/IS605 family transposase [Paludibacteraceae bacterium]|nr:IS200/IS605 family transposase [Paludibacteraceae bacterium]
MSHSVLFYHMIWRTKFSNPTINPAYENKLYAYISGYCQRKRCKLYQIGGIANHIHILVDIRPDIKISEFIQVLKVESSKWMKDNRIMYPVFEGWADGYAVFSYSEKDKYMIVNYIKNQKKHHEARSLITEYEQILKEWNVDIKDDRFLHDDKGHPRP